MASSAAATGRNIGAVLNSVPPHLRVPTVSKLTSTCLRVVGLNPHAMTIGGSNTYLVGKKGLFDEKINNNKRNNSDGHIMCDSKSSKTEQHQHQRQCTRTCACTHACVPLASDSPLRQQCFGEERQHGNIKNDEKKAENTDVHSYSPLQNSSSLQTTIEQKREKTQQISDNRTVILVDSGEGKPLYPAAINYALWCSDYSGGKAEEDEKGEVDSVTTCSVCSDNSSSCSVASSSYYYWSSSSAAAAASSSSPTIGGIFLTHWHGDHVGGICDIVMDARTSLREKVKNTKLSRGSASSSPFTDFSPTLSPLCESTTMTSPLSIPFAIFKKDGVVMPNKWLCQLLDDQIRLKVRIRKGLIQHILASSSSPPTATAAADDEDVHVEGKDTYGGEQKKVIFFDIRKSITLSIPPLHTARDDEHLLHVATSTVTLNDEDLWQFASKHFFFANSSETTSLFSSSSSSSPFTENRPNTRISFIDGLPSHFFDSPNLNMQNSTSEQITSGVSGASSELFVPLLVASLEEELDFLDAFCPFNHHASTSTKTTDNNATTTQDLNSSNNNNNNNNNNENRDIISIIDPETLAVSTASGNLTTAHNNNDNKAKKLFFGGSIGTDVCYNITATAISEDDGGSQLGIVREIGVFDFNPTTSTTTAAINKNDDDSIRNTRVDEGRSLVSVLVSPGHTDDHTLLFIQEDKALLTADTVLGGFSAPLPPPPPPLLKQSTSEPSSALSSTPSLLTPPPQPVTTAFTCYKDYMATLEALSSRGKVRITATTNVIPNNNDTCYPKNKYYNDCGGEIMKIKTIFPGHGPTIPEETEHRVDYYIAHRKKREDQVIEVLGAWLKEKHRRLQQQQEQEQEEQQHQCGDINKGQQRKSKALSAAVSDIIEERKRPFIVRSPSLATANKSLKQKSNSENGTNVTNNNNNNNDSDCEKKIEEEEEEDTVCSYAPTTAAGLVDTIYKGVVPAGSNLVTAAQNNVLHILRKLRAEGRISLAARDHNSSNDQTKSEESEKISSLKPLPPLSSVSDTALAAAFLSEEDYPRQLFVLPPHQQPNSEELLFREGVYGTLGGGGESPPPQKDENSNNNNNNNNNNNVGNVVKKPNAQRYSTELVWEKSVC